jgi:pentatricopeptide repeat protein
VYKALAAIDVTYNVQHFIPLIDAYSQSDDLRQAFIVMKIMRDASITPPRTHYFESLINMLSSSSATLDKAFFILQDIVQKEGKELDICAFNVVLDACLRAKDTTRAIACYRDIQSLNLAPDLVTYNLMLLAAQTLANVDLAMHILADLKAANLSPDRETYARVILTYVAREGNGYDDAFLYLNEMRSRKFKPTYHLLFSLVKKCVYHRDPRAQQIAREMDESGDASAVWLYISNSKRMGNQDIVLNQRQLAYERRREAESQADDLLQDMERLEESFDEEM